MWFQCDACGVAVDHDPVRLGEPLPRGWWSRTIQWHRFLFCSRCSGPSELLGDTFLDVDGTPYRPVDVED